MSLLACYCPSLLPHLSCTGTSTFITLWCRIVRSFNNMRVGPGCALDAPPRSGIVASSKKNTSETLTRPRSQPSGTPDEPHTHARDTPHTTARPARQRRTVRRAHKQPQPERIVCGHAHSERINYPKTRSDTQGRRITTRYAKRWNTRQQKRRQQSAAQHAGERVDEWGGHPRKRGSPPRVRSRKETKRATLRLV